MKLIGLMPVRNEAWCLGLTLRVALMWCDEVVILDHQCTDLSIAIVEDVDPGANRTTLLLETGEWDEMRHRQRMLQTARDHGATHIAIIDADEILTGNLAEKAGPHALFRSQIKLGCKMPPGYILQLPGYNLRNGINEYHSNGVWGNRWFSLAFADEPRLGWSGDKFHSREPGSLHAYRPIQQGAGGVMHLWGANERRLRAKHALYKITERLRWPDKPVECIDDLYSLAIKPREPWTFAPVPAEWWRPYAHLMKHLDLEVEPWQEAECRRLVAEHGAARFKGLDLFEVA